MQLSYRKYFTVELLHEYRTDGKADAMELSLSDDTKAAFRALNMEWRSSDNLYFAFIRENENGEPFPNTPPDKTFRTKYKETVFRLYLSLTKPVVLNYTNINPIPFAQQLLLFSNLTKNEQDDVLYLSHKIDDVGAGGYVPEDLAMKAGTNEVYEAIKVQTAGAVKPLSDKDFWVLKGNKQYPSYKKDGIDYTSGNYTFQLNSSSTMAAIEINKFNFDAVAPDYNVPIRSETTFFEQVTDAVPVSFSGLAPGQYLVKVNGESRFVYFDPALAQQNILAVIEIYNHLPAADKFALLDADEKIRSIKYVLQFSKRNVLWKFTRKNDKATSLQDTSNTYAFALHGNNFVSTTPIPLSEAGLQTLQLNFTNPATNHPISPLPNPSGQSLKKHEQDGFNYLCSGIFLNY